VQLEIGS
jgi:hypothetical protein